jgi:hypothetical protein
VCAFYSNLISRADGEEQKVESEDMQETFGLVDSYPVNFCPVDFAVTCR